MYAGAALAAGIDLDRVVPRGLEKKCNASRGAIAGTPLIAALNLSARSRRCYLRCQGLMVMIGQTTNIRAHKLNATDMIAVWCSTMSPPQQGEK